MYEMFASARDMSAWVIGRPVPSHEGRCLHCAIGMLPFQEHRWNDTTQAGTPASDGSAAGLLPYQTLART